MTEIEQLRKEINELRERLCVLEHRRALIEKSEYADFQKAKQAFLDQIGRPQITLKYRSPFGIHVGWQ